jgi:hypothetical protein
METRISYEPLVTVYLFTKRYVLELINLNIQHIKIIGSDIKILFSVCIARGNYI